MDNRNERAGAAGGRQGIRGSDLRQWQQGGRTGQPGGDFHQCQQQAESHPAPGRSRGEAYDERQGGGRDAESTSEWDRQQGTAGAERQTGSTGGGLDPTQAGRRSGSDGWDQQQGQPADDRQQGAGAEFKQDQRRHQDRGQGDIEFDSNQ